MEKKIYEIESELVKEILQKFEEIGIDTSKWERIRDGKSPAEFIQAGIKWHIWKVKKGLAF